ncbi:PREDICTED: DNA repair protein XRCC4-like isoform X2 [Dinoponera quadriceps]|nr:PREDICTED: DNA repair protein XRCC4-like isoform X2 [Dinoponera quadriceps]
MHPQNIIYFLDHLDESFDTYLEKTKRAFSGESMEIQFFLQDDTFMWKEQNILTRGEITVSPISNILIISDTLKEILERYRGCRERMITLEKENEYLNESNVKLNIRIEKTVGIKENMEKDFYRKFLLLLNSKKQRIRELQEALDKKTTKTEYDETTDENEGSDVEDKRVQETSIKSTNIRKRKTNSQEDEQKDKSNISKRNFMRCTNFFSSENSSPEPSTSKDKSILKNADVQHITMATEQLNTSEEEPEDDLFSQ